MEVGEQAGGRSRARIGFVCAQTKPLEVALDRAGLRAVPVNYVNLARASTQIESMTLCGSVCSRASEPTS